MHLLHRTLACFVVFASASAFAQQPITNTSCTYCPVHNLYGVVVDPLGARVPGATVEVLADDAALTVLETATTGAEGGYMLDIPTGGARRFRLRATAPTFAATVTEPLFLNAKSYAQENLTLASPTLSQEITVSATGTPTPLAQSGAPITVLPSDQFLEALEIQQPLTLIPGVQTTSNGQPGGATSLFLRGGNSEFTKVLLDGVPVNDIGSGADLSTLSADGVARIEVLRQPNSVLYGSDLSSGVVSLSTLRGSTPLPLFTYAVDGGNFGTLHQAVSVAGARGRFDYATGFAALQTANQTPDDNFRDSTVFGNYGYAPDSRSDVRFTFRHINTNSGVPNAIALYGIPDFENQFYQETFLNGAGQQQTTPKWHNLVRYGWEAINYTNIQYAPDGTQDQALGESLGDPVTISGANGYTTSGQAQLDYLGASFGTPSERTARRSFVYAQSDYQVNHHLDALGSFQYEAEKGASSFATASRGNYSYTLQAAGNAANRLFYVVGSGIEDNALYGKALTPRASVAFYAVRPDTTHFLSGTKLHASFGKGVEEPSVAEQVESLYGTLQTLTGGPALIAKDNIQTLGGEFSRTYDAGVEQQFGDGRARINLSYFHNQFNNVLEYVPSQFVLINGLQLLGVPPDVATDPDIYGAYVNSLAYRSEGAEIESEFRLDRHLFVRAGYTYLDAKVQRSFASDAYGPSFNSSSNFSTIPIGNYGPLDGARPFRRAPHSGYFSLQYTRARLSSQLSGTLVGRRDDSTFLGGSDVNYGNSLLLPNRNLDGAYQRLELSSEYRINSHITTYADLQNLLNEHYFEAFGYPALPFNVRGGFRFTFGGESFHVR